MATLEMEASPPPLTPTPVDYDDQQGDEEEEELLLGADAEKFSGSMSEKDSVSSDRSGSGSSSHPEDSTGTGSPGSPGSSSVSTASSEEEYNWDTEVFFPVRSMKLIAETVGTKIDDLCANLLGQTAINRLRHLTLLAMQFSRHGRSPGLRVSDMEKAEKVFEGTPSLGYGFTQKLPDYMKVGDVMVESEGVDVDLSTITHHPAVETVLVDQDVDEILKSKYLHYHDKYTKDKHEKKLCPSFEDIFKNWTFDQTSLTPRIPRNYYGSNNRFAESSTGQFNGTAVAGTSGRSYPQPSSSQDGSKLPESGWNGDSNQSDEFYQVSVEECGDISIQTCAKAGTSKTVVPDQSHHQAGSEKMSLHAGADVECVENDFTLNAVPKQVIKTETGDEGFDAFEDMDVTECSGTPNENMVLKFESSELGDMFNENMFLKQQKYRSEDENDVVQLPTKPGTSKDFYTSGEFLLHQDVLGDEIFSEDVLQGVEEEETHPKSSLKNVVSLTWEPDEAAQQSFSDVDSLKSNFSPDIVCDDSGANAVETEATTSYQFRDADEEFVQYQEDDSDNDNEEEEGPSTPDTAGEPSRKDWRSRPPSGARRRSYDEDFEIVYESDSPNIEIDSDDSDSSSEDEEGQEGVPKSQLFGDVPAAWGTYVQNFIVAFYENEDVSETFEKESFNFYPQDPEQDNTGPQYDNFQILLRDVEKHGVFPVLHIICEFFHNFLSGMYEFMGGKQLRRITSFIDSTLACPVQCKTYHLKPMLAILMDMLILPVPCKIQIPVTKTTLKIADYSEHPFNREVIKWITNFINGVLESSSKLTLEQLTPHIKSRIFAAIQFALGYDARGLRLKRMHQWIQYVILISNNHYVIHYEPQNYSNQLTNNDEPTASSAQRRSKLIRTDSTDSYLEEAILLFIRTYYKNYHSDGPDDTFRPWLEQAIENYGVKLTSILADYERFLMSTKSIRRRHPRLEDVSAGDEDANKIVNEFLMRPGWVYSGEKGYVKVKIPFVMCVL